MAGRLCPARPRVMLLPALLVTVLLARVVTSQVIPHEWEHGATPKRTNKQECRSPDSMKHGNSGPPPGTFFSYALLGAMNVVSAPSYIYPCTCPYTYIQSYIHRCHSGWTHQHNTPSTSSGIVPTTCTPATFHHESGLGPRGISAEGTGEGPGGARYHVIFDLDSAVRPNGESKRLNAVPSPSPEPFPLCLLCRRLCGPRWRRARL